MSHFGNTKKNSVYSDMKIKRVNLRESMKQKQQLKLHPSYNFDVGSKFECLQSC